MFLGDDSSSLLKMLGKLDEVLIDLRRRKLVGKVAIIVLERDVSFDLN